MNSSLLPFSATVHAGVARPGPTADGSNARPIETSCSRFSTLPSPREPASERSEVASEPTNRAAIAIAAAF